MVELPFIDEHVTDVEATADDVWAALLRVLDRMAGRPATAYARLVGSDDVSAAGPRPLAKGSTIPGFHVATARPPVELVLAGRHRFSEYTLTFRVDELATGSSQLRAETRASFPGIAGGVYRLLVIGTRGHVLAVQRMLSSIRSTAERN